MSISLGSWLAGTGSLPASQFSLRAEIQWSRILDKQTDIELYRNEAFLPTQTVRIEFDDYFMNAVDDSGNSTSRKAVVFGVRGHPTIDDLDIELWDTFILEDKEYTVVSVNKQLIGQIQAYCEAVG